MGGNPGTRYREPFCYQMGPYQTLRAENWCTQLLVRFRIFFEFKKYENHLNGSKIPGTCYSGKKSPCQEACKQSSGVGKHPQMVNPSKFNPGFGQIQISRYPDDQTPRKLKIKSPESRDAQASLDAQAGNSQNPSMHKPTDTSQAGEK